MSNMYDQAHIVKIFIVGNYFCNVVIKWVIQQWWLKTTVYVQR